jgi:hypothetical protein
LTSLSKFLEHTQPAPLQRCTNLLSSASLLLRIRRSRSAGQRYVVVAAVAAAVARVACLPRKACLDVAGPHPPRRVAIPPTLRLDASTTTSTRACPATRLTDRPPDTLSFPTALSQSCAHCCQLLACTKSCCRERASALRPEHNRRSSHCPRLLRHRPRTWRLQLRPRAPPPRTPRCPPPKTAKALFLLLLRLKVSRPVPHCRASPPPLATLTRPAPSAPTPLLVTTSPSAPVPACPSRHLSIWSTPTSITNHHVNRARQDQDRDCHPRTA